LRGEELARRLKETGPRAVIAETAALPSILALRERVPSLRRVIITDDAPAGTTSWAALLEGRPRKPVRLAPDAPMAIVYTGGTTAPASAVLWRHGGSAAAGSALAQLLGLGGLDRLMIVLPLFGANALFSVAMALASGGSILLEREFSAPTFWLRARRGGATQVSLSGLFLSQLQAIRNRKSDGDHAVRCVLATATPRDLHEAFENRFGVTLVEGYGLTEAGIVALNPLERGLRKLGTVGLPLPWWEVAVLDDGMSRLTAGATGEICIRPRPDAVVSWGGEYLLEHHANGRPRNGKWLRTGDLGVCDEEGFVTLLDRREDVVERHGQAFSTRKIEQVLLRHPAVADAAVIPLPGRGAEDLLALVVLRAPVRFDDIARFCREWLDGHPVPSCFKAVERVPKTPLGRVRKAELRGQPGIFEHLIRVA
jgi:crotonobetaine/carnitine-CoA ligase